MIELSKIAALAGQPGLFQIKTPLKNGVMMESLDEKKTLFTPKVQMAQLVLSLFCRVCTKNMALLCRQPQNQMGRISRIC